MGAQWGHSVALLVIQTVVVRAVAMITEKKAHPKDPWSSLPQRGTGQRGESTACGVTPAAAWVLILTLRFQPHVTSPERLSQTIIAKWTPHFLPIIVIS